MSNLNFTCTIDTCSLDQSFYNYRPSLGINATLAGIYGTFLVIGLIQGIWFRTWTFLVAFTLGNGIEIAGYIGRILSYENPFQMAPFLLQIVSLTLAPAYYAAGIYLCLSRLVTIYDSSISRLRPINYTRLFIGCDIISLSLQGAGGGLASTSASDNQPTTTGNNVMIAGLGFQVLTLGLFMVLSAEFAFRVYKGDKSSRNPLYVDLRSRKRFKAFIGALILSTTCIMIRSIYRLIEMSQGWSGTLQKNETYFFILEGVMVIIAVGALLLHPGWCLMGAYQAKEKGDVDIEMKMRDSEDRI